jgi:hypothetical protein
MELCKYSKKIHYFLDHNEILNNIKFEIKNNLIDKIKNIFIESIPDDYILNETKTILKINNSETPLVFTAIKKFCTDVDRKCYDMKSPEIYKNLHKFVSWYRENQVKYGYELYSCLNKNTTINKKIHGNKVLLNLLYNNYFISLDVQLLIEKNNLCHETYRTNKVNLELLTVIDSYYPNVKTIFKIVNFIKTFCDVKKEVNLVCFYGNQKKYLNLNGNKIICPDNTNTGCTNRNRGVISIWRMEEFYKVLMHELLHYFNKDMDTNLSDKENKVLTELKESIFNINGFDYTPEAYTESVACILNCCVVSQLLNISFNELMTYEIKFAYFQIAKICVYFGIEDFNELFDKSKPCKFKQVTSVLSYYIIKTLMLLNIEGLFDILNEKSSDIKKNKYLEFYKTVVGKHEINISTVNKLISSFDKTNVSFVYRTMRLTVNSFC